MEVCDHRTIEYPALEKLKSHKVYTSKMLVLRVPDFELVAIRSSLCFAATNMLLPPCRSIAKAPLSICLDVKSVICNDWTVRRDG